MQYTGSCLKKKQNFVPRFFSKLIIFSPKAYTSPKISAQVIWCTKCSFCDNACKVIHFSSQNVSDYKLALKIDMNALSRLLSPRRPS